MEKKSLRKEQVELLRFEKQLLSLGAGLAALTAGAGANAAEAVGEVAEKGATDIQAAYLNLVATVQSAHAAIEESAHEAGFRLLQAAGQPKDDPPVLEAALSLLGMR